MLLSHILTFIQVLNRYSICFCLFIASVLGFEIVFYIDFSLFYRNVFLVRYFDGYIEEEYYKNLLHFIKQKI